MEMKYIQIFFELNKLKIIYELRNDINNNINQTNKNYNIYTSRNSNNLNEDNILFRISLYKIDLNIIITKIKLT